MCLKDLSLIFLVFSVVAFVREIVLAIKYFIIKKNSGMSFRTKLFRLAAVLMLSIWFLRLFVEVSEKNEAWASFNFIEKLLDSFVHTFQTFSLDEDYTLYTNIGKNVLINRFESDIAGILFGFYSSIINVLAPILGGGLLFEILTSFFPKFRLDIACKSKKNKYIFSELNEQAVALAKSIKEKDPHSIIIYTDTYVDPSDERETELYAEAKKENAICVKDDISNVLCDTKIGLKGQMECFLIDENEYNNSTALATIILHKASRNKLYGNKLKIFHTSSIDSLIEEKAIWNMYSRDEKKSAEGNNVDIQLINCYRLIAWDLFFKCPLFTPLLHQKEPKQLNLTVIGVGSIGMENFLSATWFGQILDGNEQHVHLNISIIDNKPCDEFLKRIIAINPEILMQSQEKSPLLKIYPNATADNDYGDPYYTLYYSEENIENADLEKLKCQKVCFSEENGYTVSDESTHLVDSDYIIVALGSDNANILVAERLKRQFVYTQTKSEDDTNNDIKKVIAYAVYDDNVNDMLMNGKKYELENGILMYAFANLSDIYNYKKISAGEFIESAKFTQAAYNQTNTDNQNLKPGEEGALYKKNYSYWSTLARNFDFFYKVYSAFGKSYVPLLDDEEKEEELIKEFARKFEVEKGCNISAPENSFMRKIMWQEHRRWNAYMRQQGYRSAPPEIKDFKFKWHYCLGECDDKYFYKRSEVSNPDHLDNIFKNNGINHKTYDLPCHFDSDKDKVIWGEGFIGDYKKNK